MYNGKIIIDCGGLDIRPTTGETQKIPGLFAKLLSALSKNVDILLTGCLYGLETPLAPFSALVCQASNKVIFVIVSKIQIEVSNDDTVTIDEVM